VVRSWAANDTKPMKKNDLLKSLGIGLIVAMIATGIFYGLLVGKLSSKPANMNTLVVAAKALKGGTILQSSDLKTIPWPSELPKGAYGSVDQVVGSTVFDAIAEDEPVTSWRLANQQNAGGAGVPAGMRAVSVHVTDSSGVLALLRAGQTVDVQVVVNRGGDKSVSLEERTAIEGLTVLAVHAAPEPTSQGLNLPAVTLLAKPAEADVLATADSGARVRLALRNPLDQSTRPRPSLSLDSVMRADSPGRTAATPGQGGAAPAANIR